MDDNIAKVYEILRKSTEPIQKRHQNIQNRIKFANILRMYIKNVERCLTIEKSTINLKSKDDSGGTKLIQFKKRIGSKSKYGMAYLNTGYGLSKILKFSIKIMQNDEFAYQEISVLNQVTRLVERYKTPHLPLVYKILYCNEPCIKTACPRSIKNTYNGYYLVLNELANYDLKTFLKREHPSNIIINIITQILLAIYNLHLINILHKDCHLGNFLIHEIEQGGFWHYNVFGKDFYLENLGFQVVIWDFGLSKTKPNVKNSIFEKDYKRVFKLMSRIQNFSTSSRRYAELSDDAYSILSRIEYSLYKFFNENEFVNDALFNIINVICKRPQSIINNRPFTLI